MKKAVSNKQPSLKLLFMPTAYCSLTLELDSESDLTFASGQHLGCRAERLERNALLPPDCGWILTIQQIEELEQDLHLDPLADVESLGKAHIEIDEGGGGESIPPGGRINIVNRSVAVRVNQGCGNTAEAKAALRPEDAADLDLPGNLNQPR